MGRCGQTIYENVPAKRVAGTHPATQRPTEKRPSSPGSPHATIWRPGGRRPSPADTPTPPSGGRGGGGPPPRTPPSRPSAAPPPHRPTAGGKAPSHCPARRKAGVGIEQYARNVIQTESNAIRFTDRCWGRRGPTRRTPAPRHSATHPPRHPAAGGKVPSRCPACRQSGVNAEEYVRNVIPTERNAIKFTDRC